MTLFDVTLFALASQSLKVEAEDYEDAIEIAMSQGIDQPNLHNKFEFGEEIKIGPVYNIDDGNLTIVYEGDENVY